MPDNHPVAAPDHDRGEYSVMPVMVHSPTEADLPIWQELAATGSAVEVWLNSYRSENTRVSYRLGIRYWLEWCRDHGVNVARARRADVDAYARFLDEFPLAASTRAKRLSTVSSFYRYWLLEGILERNPAAHVARPRVSDEPGSIALTRQQMTQLLSYVDGQGLRPAIVVRLLAELGLRVSELCGARVADLGYSSGHRTLTVTRKGDIRATFPIPPRTAALIDEWLAGRTDGPILVTRSGLEMRRQYVRKLLRRLAKESGLPDEVWQRMHPHVLRHTAATLLDESGRTIQDIQRLLGHADTRTTERYTHHRASLEASPVYDLAGLLAA